MSPHRKSLTPVWRTVSGNPALYAEATSRSWADWILSETTDNRIRYIFHGYKISRMEQELAFEETKFREKRFTRTQSRSRREQFRHSTIHVTHLAVLLALFRVFADLFVAWECLHRLVLTP